MEDMLTSTLAGFSFFFFSVFSLSAAVLSPSNSYNLESINFCRHQVHRQRKNNVRIIGQRKKKEQNGPMYYYKLLKQGSHNVEAPLQSLDQPKDASSVPDQTSHPLQPKEISKYG